MQSYRSENLHAASFYGGTSCPRTQEFKTNFEYIGTPIGQQCLKFCNREKLAYKYLRLLILESNHHNHNHHHHHHHHHHCVEVSVSSTVKHAKMESCHLCKTPQMMMMIMMIIIIIIVIIIIIIVIIMVSGECELYREACEDGVLPGETILAYHGVCREKPCSKSKYFDLLNQIK